MNAVEIRKYWSAKYKSVFDDSYKTDNYGLEVVFLKRLIDKYGEYVVLEAIDQYFSPQFKKLISVRYFCSQKVFTNKFASIIKQSDIMKYIKLFNTYPKQAQDRIMPLLKEYQEYCIFESISDKEKVRKEEIVKVLEEMTNNA